MARSIITPDAVMRSIQSDYKKARQRMEAAMEKVEQGTVAHMNHVRAIYELSQAFRKEAREFGLVAQDLGVVTKQNFIFEAKITPSGEHVVENAADQERRRKFNEELNEEFGFADKKPFMPALPDTEGEENE